ncbi:MAG: cell division protein CrgA [Actinomycetota bacterium]
MPKSKVRKKSDGPATGRPAAATAASSSRAMRPSPTWYPIVMAAVLILGLVYLVVYYLAADKIPLMQDIGAWNFAVGFGILIAGMGMAVRWR